MMQLLFFVDAAAEVDSDVVYGDDTTAVYKSDFWEWFALLVQWEILAIIY